MGKKPIKGQENLTHKGREKGSKNKFTTLKQAFLDAFEGLGGADELQRWAKLSKNKKDFYQMVTKLLPKEIDGKFGLDEKTLALIMAALPPKFAKDVEKAITTLKD